MDNFYDCSYMKGQEIMEKNRSVPTMLCGMIDAVEAHGGTCIPSVSMQSRSGGPVDFAVVEHFLETVGRYIEAERNADGTLRIDGVFLALHGATQSSRQDDCCGYILKRIREQVGPDTVITVGCDLHANVTDTMLENTDFICGFQTYPHVDLYETGYRSAKLGMHKLLNGKPLYSARIKIPMLIPASGYTNIHGAFREVMDLAHDLAEQYQVCDFSVFQVQPWLDAQPLFSTVLVISEDPDISSRMAVQVGQKLFDNRTRYTPSLASIDSIIHRAYEKRGSGKPIILVDMADSPNGGAIGDSVSVLVRLMDLKLPIYACTVVCDVSAVLQAFEVGVDGEAEFTFGASLTPGDVPGPVTVNARVVSLHNGVFMRDGQVSRSNIYSIGRSAVINFGYYTVLLCEHPVGTGETQIYRHFGIEPLVYDLVVVKANTSFRAYYEPIAEEIYMADTPGACSSNLTSLPYKRVPKDKYYPFVSLDSFVIPDAEIYCSARSSDN